MKATFEHATPETENIFSFYFKPEKHLNFTAGQYLELTLPHKNPDNRGIKRWFTISSSPNNSLFSLTTKIVKHGSTFKKHLLTLKPGQEVLISEPIGDFVLPKFIQTPLIFVAGGIGITPFNSMLQWIHETKEERNIKFIYAVNTEDEIIFQDTFEAAGQHVTIIVSNPSDAWGGEQGPLTADVILGLQKPDDNCLIFLCGPEPMVKQIKHELKMRRVADHQIVSDAFSGLTSI